MRIGISLLNVCRSHGGQYQYALTFAQSLTRHDTVNQYVVFHDSPDFSPQHFRDAHKVEMVFVSAQDGKAYWARGLRRLAYVLGLRLDMQFMRGKYDALRRARLDLVVQPSPGAGPLFAGVPYIVSIHDLAHKDLPGSGGLR